MHDSKRRTYVAACAVALFLAAGLLGAAHADSRCYPNSRYVQLSDNLVRDTLTSLVWQQTFSPTKMAYAQALVYCPSGYRLPTVKELQSIIDPTVASGGVRIDPIAFPNTPYDDFWSSTPLAANPSNAWYVSFSGGNWNSGPTSTSRYVRCIRWQL